MKIKTINRSSDTYVPVKSTQESYIPRNLNKELHPLERAREYTKALQATKLERVFAKPFIKQLGRGHADGVYQIAKNFNILNQIATSDGDGIVKFWNLNQKSGDEEVLNFKGHYGMVSGLSFTQKTDSTNGMLLSCANDKTIKLWDVGTLTNELTQKSQNSDGGNYQSGDKLSKVGLVKTFHDDYAFQSIDTHKANFNQFVTGGQSLKLWDMTRSAPISDMSWGNNTVQHVRFNHSETDIVLSSGTDNSVVLYDLRTNNPIQKMVQQMRTNSMCFNPIEPMNFAVACEDHNLYYYDMRNLTKALQVFKDHVAAVLDCDISPLGTELVSSSYDKTIRIYDLNHGHSKEVYHTKRMQHVFQCKYTMDSKYLLSGSDDGNVRLWRAKAWERSDVKNTKYKNKLEYDEKLKEKFKYMPEIRKIKRHRHLPGVVKKAQEIKNIEVTSLKRREANENRYRKEKKYVSEREKHIVRKVFD
ncbi:hypothetical protein FOG50_00878 [Hanseniaspora uvarum]|uniref:DDB1- and CUL4-associated factor 13 n=1 Tax=Hanseniaspora uvarum TaxID=29833 RepID=A0A1E5RYA2_HANUV|nr:hypothetical protein FOG50_00878 [Hanseniaspora uvarum]OEJ91947.1 Protein SOF1 [Hanseniaspora uvarum]GMM40928.1 rRNA-processing protein [Hanseniaspora uvarum]